MMRALLGEAADEAQVGIVVHDETGKVIAANKAMCAILGYDLDELLELKPGPLRRKDGSDVPGRYVDAQTTIAHLDYTISFFEPER
jgi:PAS domain-containing protein